MAITTKTRLNLNHLLLLLIVIICPTTFAENTTTQDALPTLVMGYKEGSKPPYIGSLGDNSGTYQDLFSKAAKMIGHTLKIVRLPKKRIYHHLELGDIDFYPAAGFSKKRQRFLYWLPNGLLTKQVLVSTIDHEDIQDFSRSEGTLLAPLGSSKISLASNFPNIRVQKMGKLPIDKAIHALQLGRGDFYIYDLDILQYYLKRNELNSFEDIRLKLHINAIEKETSSLQAAFSIYSPKFKPEYNTHFDTTRPADENNQEITPAKDSIAYKFAQALKTLRESGETQKIYTHYFQ